MELAISYELQSQHLGVDIHLYSYSTIDACCSKQGYVYEQCAHV